MLLKDSELRGTSRVLGIVFYNEIIASSFQVRLTKSIKYANINKLVPLKSERIFMTQRAKYIKFGARLSSHPPRDPHAFAIKVSSTELPLDTSNFVTVFKDGELTEAGSESIEAIKTRAQEGLESLRSRA